MRIPGGKQAQEAYELGRQLSIEERDRRKRRMTMNTEDILLEVNTERQRQEVLKESGKFVFSCADKGMSEAEKLAVLSEEIGEVSKEVVELVIELSKVMKFRMTPEARTTAIEAAIKEYKGKARKELIQVAAVSVAWIEALSDD